jgi:hypothetical protein
MINIKLIKHDKMNNTNNYQNGNLETCIVSTEGTEKKDSTKNLITESKQDYNINYNINIHTNIDANTLEQCIIFS